MSIELVSVTPVPELSSVRYRFYSKSVGSHVGVTLSQKFIEDKGTNGAEAFARELALGHFKRYRRRGRWGN